jgi:hypothetical protein
MAMSTTSPHGDYERARAEYDAASVELYRSELALHDAHQSGVDAWVQAANDHLHRALMRHYRAQAALEPISAGVA